MELNFRSICPLSSALDIMGDKWSLLIIRDMIYLKKRTFKEFSQSREKIATNILSSRLKLLENVKLIYKQKSPYNKKINLYLLTEKGIRLTPTITELILWSEENIDEYHPNMNSIKDQILKTSKSEFDKKLERDYRKIVQENPPLSF